MIIDLLHRFAYSISNNQCLYWEKALANAVLRNIFDNGNVFIPKGLQKGQRIMFHIDNANFSEDTTDGKRVTGALMMAGFQRRLTNTMNTEDHFLEVDQCCRTQTLDTTEFNNLEYCFAPNDKNFTLPTGCEKYEKKHVDGNVNLPIDIRRENLPWIL